MPNYRTTSLPESIRVTEIMSFFTTCFDRSAIVRDRKETYPFWAMIYTAKGSITFRIDGAEYRVRAGEIVFYPPSVPHSIVAFDEKSWEVSFVTFAAEGPLMDALAGKVITPDADTSERLRAFFRFGGKYFYNLPPKGDNTIGMYCSAGKSELLYVKTELEALLSKLRLTGIGGRSQSKSRVFREAVEYMQAHLGEPIPLAHLAAVTGVSVSTLKNVFRKESGGGVNSYYIGMKLSHGAKLLCETDAAVGEIAERLGFSSQFYFSEQFKAQYGLPPLAYRKQQESARQGLF